MLLNMLADLLTVECVDQIFLGKLNIVFYRLHLLFSVLVIEQVALCSSRVTELMVPLATWIIDIEFV